MLLLGFIDADAATLRRVLRKPGRAVMLAVGGAEEALLARPGRNDLVLNKRCAVPALTACKQGMVSLKG